MKLGEKLMFGFAVLVAVAAVGKGLRHINATEPGKPRDYYEWTEAGLQGHALYRSMGCNSCHRALGVGEIGVAPVLDGEGTRRTQAWLTSYFRESRGPGAGHCSRRQPGPGFSRAAGPRARPAGRLSVRTQGEPRLAEPPQPPAGSVGEGRRLTTRECNAWARY